MSLSEVIRRLGFKPKDAVKKNGVDALNSTEVIDMLKIRLKECTSSYPISLLVLTL